MWEDLRIAARRLTAQHNSGIAHPMTSDPARLASYNRLGEVLGSEHADWSPDRAPRGSRRLDELAQLGDLGFYSPHRRRKIHSIDNGPVAGLEPLVDPGQVIVGELFQ